MRVTGKAVSLFGVVTAMPVGTMSIRRMNIGGVSFDVEVGSNYVTFTHTALSYPGNEKRLPTFFPIRN